MTWPPSAVTLAVVALVTAGSITDLRSRRVPNVMTFTAALTALLYHAALGGWQGAAASVGGAVIGLLLFLPLFVLGGMGAGDVKLLAAIGAWLGPSGAVWTALYAALAGGVLALIVGLAHGYLRSAVSNLWGLAGFWRAAGFRPHPELTLSTAAGPRLPYALAIGIGALVTLWRH